MLSVFFVPIFTLASLGYGPAFQDNHSDTTGLASLVLETQNFSDTVELAGVFVPANGHEISFWPEAYAGPLLFLEVLEHGTYVNQGDVIARFELETLEDQIREAELDLNSTQIQNENAHQRAAIEEDAAAAARETAELALRRAEEDLESWKEFAAPFRLRSKEMTAQRIQHNIDDQQDELDQLQAMYQDDELVDATEEIVLKRARRNLAASKAGQKLNHDQQDYDRKVEVARQTELKEEAIISQRRALDRLLRTHELEGRSRGDQLLRSSKSLEKKHKQLGKLRRDLEQLMLKAPESGTLLHGGMRSYGPLTAHPSHLRGGSATPRQPLFCIVPPEALAVAVHVPEAKLGSPVRNGMPVNFSPVSAPNTTVLGSLELNLYPTPASASAAEGQHEGRVDFDQKLPGVVVGMRATLEVVTDTLQDILCVPETAVFGTGDESHCFVISQDGSTRKVAIKLGPRKGSEVVVEGNLAAGDRVLLSKPTPNASP